MTVYVWGILAGSAVGLLARPWAGSTPPPTTPCTTPGRRSASRSIRVVLTVVLGYLFAIPLPGMLGIDQRWGVAGLTASAGLAGWVEFILLRRDAQRPDRPDRHPAVVHRLGCGAAPWSAAAAAWVVKLALTGGTRSCVALFCLGMYGAAYFAITASLGVPQASACGRRGSGGIDPTHVLEPSDRSTASRRRSSGSSTPFRKGPVCTSGGAADGEVLYVGKAKRLRSRVRSYFATDFPDSPRNRLLQRLIADVETIVVPSEPGSLILENNLIKEYRPRFNVRLKDDKSYPSIAVTLAEPFPRVLVTRKRDIPGARYFGPYTDVGQLRRTLAIIRRLYTVRSCQDRLPEERRERPCLDYYIGRCRAPCMGWQDMPDYQRMVD